jgi:hypothetical protein
MDDEQAVWRQLSINLTEMWSPNFISCPDGQLQQIWTGYSKRETETKHATLCKRSSAGWISYTFQGQVRCKEGAERVGAKKSPLLSLRDVCLFSICKTTPE